MLYNLIERKKDIMLIKNKLIGFPKILLECLEEYKKKTGISISSYIKEAVSRKMIADGLIHIKIKYINIEVKK